MQRQEIIEKIKKHENSIREMGVSKLSLFGSVARDEADDASDVDFLIEFDRTVGLFHFFKVQHYLEKILGVPKVDLLMPGAIKPALRERITAEALRVA